jgi:oxygen-independent coproporphyrinogen-3 oxidase
VPFCESKCPYCAFPSAVRRNGDEEIYLGAVEREMSESSHGTLETLYIGGGTPSVLSLASWMKLTALIEKFFNFAEDAEVTVEANPSSLKTDHLRLWRDWRVNRTSIGVQSFDDARLSFLGRTHRGAAARDSVAACLGAGFSVSLDLMFGLPHESLRDWASDLRAALALGPHHISIYQMSIEPGTPFAEENFALPEGYAQYRYAQWALPKAGYGQYEVASFARAGCESAHNLNYWADGEYLGLGPAAWSFQNGERRRNDPSLEGYAKKISSKDAAIYRELLDGERAARQAAVLALRTREGIRAENFRRKYGQIHADAIMRDLGNFPAALVATDDDGARLTARGLRVANSIWSDLI